MPITYALDPIHYPDLSLHLPPLPCPLPRPRHPCAPAQAETYQAKLEPKEEEIALLKADKEAHDTQLVLELTRLQDVQVRVQGAGPQGGGRGQGCMPPGGAGGMQGLQPCR